MKRIERLLVLISLLVVLILSTSCGNGTSLGASMMVPGENEGIFVETDEYDDSDEIDEYDSEYYDEADEDGEQSEQAEQAEEDQTVDGRVITVVLNTNKDRKRIHIPDTSCANQIHEENYQEWTCTEGELVDFAKKNGYVACGRCHPDRKLNIDLPTN